LFHEQQTRLLCGKYSGHMSFKRKEDREAYWIKALQDEERIVSKKGILQPSMSAATISGWKPKSIKWRRKPRNAQQGNDS
jgi:hypothetical protein